MKIPQYSQENTCVVQALRPTTILKELSTQVLSCEYCKIFKNTYFEEQLGTTTSEHTLKFIKKSVVNRLNKGKTQYFRSYGRFYVCLKYVVLLNVPCNGLWKTFLLVTDRSSRRRCSIEKAALKNLAIFTGKHLCWSLFLTKVCNFIKKIFKRLPYPMLIVILTNSNLGRWSKCWPTGGPTGYKRGY